jgi:hypothetical protein
MPVSLKVISDLNEQDEFRISYHFLLSELSGAALSVSLATFGHATNIHRLRVTFRASNHD